VPQCRYLIAVVYKYGEAGGVHSPMLAALKRQRPDDALLPLLIDDRDQGHGLRFR
jgi:hypothetical protein